jgi:hypothetical protein
VRAAPKILIVHTKAHVAAVLEAARRLGVPVMLQSAPDAIFYAGALYLLRMFEQAKTSFPDVECGFILDCADAGAEAIMAMQTGHTHIRSAATPEIRQKLAAIAEDHSVTIHTESYESLDLQAVADTTGECIKWLKGNT